MKITVCVKQVPGTTQVDIDEKTGVLKRDGIETKMNPYDLYALETAMQIKQQTGAELTAVSMGPPHATEVIREAYMMGFDKGALFSDRRFAGSDVLATSYTLSQGIKTLGIPDITLCGKMTTDGDTAQVGPALAEFLGIPHVANVVSIVKVKDKSIVVEMDMPWSLEVVEVCFPCLLTVDKGIFQPRLPSYKLKLATSEREIPFYDMDSFTDTDENHYGLNGSPTQVLRIFSPEPNNDHELWGGDSGELAQRLYAKLEELKFV